MAPLPRLSVDINLRESPEDQPLSGYESADEDEVSRYKLLWTNVMEEGTYRNPSLYQKVHVLLLQWAKTDIDTTKEVEDLQAVFENEFGYNTTMVYLDANSEKKLQVQLNASVANFVHGHDGDNTLLIVYYAGHGRPGEFHGHLELMGHASPNDRRDMRQRERNRVVWNGTEELLKPADADVLEIFDCCCAGTMNLVRGQIRLFEYLAAVKDQGLTGVPGPTSFTRALIFGLKRLKMEKKEGRFTTDELLRKINDAPGFPEEQTPVISDRDNRGPSAGRIILHPLRDRSTSRPPLDENCAVKEARHVMTLHFDFPEKPPDNHVTAIGRSLNELFERNTLGVLCVRWGGMKETKFGQATRLFQKSLEKRRASSQNLQAPKLMTTTALTNPTDSSRLSPHAVVFETPDSADDESGSSRPPSSPATPKPEESMKTHTKEEVGFLAVEGESNVEVVCLPTHEISRE